jgi:DNA ligase-1
MSKPFEPMLAATIKDMNLVRFPMLASAKLDGIRCCIINGVAMSRNLKPIPNRHVQHLFGRHRFDYLDGELIVGKPCGEGVFNRTTSAVMSQHGEPLVSFYVFDHFGVPDAKHTDRMRAATRATNGCLDIVLVQQTQLRSVDELLAYEAKLLAKGYEGVMLRDNTVSYKFGRSTLRENGLLKLKRFVDAEAEVLSVEEMQTNTNSQELSELGRMKRSSHKAGKVNAGTLGKFNVRDCKTGIEFSIGTGEGLTAVLRAQLWAVRNTLPGRVVRYRYQPVGVKVAPRLPIFTGFRDRKDFS